LSRGVCITLDAMRQRWYHNTWNLAEPSPGTSRAPSPCLSPSSYHTPYHIHSTSLVMPPPTSSQKPNKAVAKDAPAKAPAAAAAINGATNGAKEVDEKRGLTKPDQAKYNAEQDEINKEIAAVKAKMVSHPKKMLRLGLTG
jgi:hypothetical protein